MLLVPLCPTSQSPQLERERKGENAQADTLPNILGKEKREFLKVHMGQAD